jgi:hypothetical protein
MLLEIKIKVSWDVIIPWRIESHGRFGRRQRLYVLFFDIWPWIWGLNVVTKCWQEFISRHDVTFQMISKFVRTTLRTSNLAQIELVSLNARHSQQNLRSFLRETKPNDTPTNLRAPLDIMHPFLLHNKLRHNNNGKKTQLYKNNKLTTYVSTNYVSSSGLY